MGYGMAVSAPGFTRFKLDIITMFASFCVTIAGSTTSPAESSTVRLLGNDRVLGMCYTLKRIDLTNGSGISIIHVRHVGDGICSSLLDQCRMFLPRCCDVASYFDELRAKLSR